MLSEKKKPANWRASSFVGGASAAMLVIFKDQGHRG
jgi:hypothetical protein